MMKTKPTRNPDKIFEGYIKFWQEPDHWLVILNLKDGIDIAYAVSGEFKELYYNEMYNAITKQLMNKYATTPPETK